jgi:hypothetical protein
MHRKPLSVHSGGRSGAPAVWAAIGLTAPVTLPRVHWLFTGLLVGVSGATAVYTLWLVRRLFTTPPAPAPVTHEQPEVTP